MARKGTKSDAKMRDDSGDDHTDHRTLPLY